MIATHDELDRFNEFARTRIDQTDEQLTLDELWDLWRLQNPNSAEHAENVAAVKAALRDMENGDRGLPAEEQIRAMREKYNLPSEQ